jgi:hypothetical protein
MKQEFIDKLRTFKADVVALKRDIGKLQTKRVSQKQLMATAEAIASKWVEEIRSPLEHKFKLDKSVIEQTSERVKKLHVLSRPNNLKKSYVQCLNGILKDYDDKFVLPIQQSSGSVTEILDLRKLLPGLPNPDESEYLREAISCAEGRFYKAAIVMGWCAAIDRMQKKILALGCDAFNNTSRALKNQTSGKFKRWNKEFNVTTLSELQTIFDSDMVVVLEGMGLLDGNQAQRLETCFQYRNHSAHPGEAPIEPAHVVSFFTDINMIVLQNSKFSLT